MPIFHALKVKAVCRETSDCVSVAFEVPESLAASYRFQAGQYLTLRTTLGGEEVRRPYSICSSPSEDGLKVAIKHIPGGKFSTFANKQLRAGDILEVMTPMGDFHVPIAASNQKRYVAFAAGSGITPVISIIKESLLRETGSTFTLFYGNRTTDAIIFRETLEGLKNKYLHRFSLFHILSREDQGNDLLSGRIDRSRLSLIFSRLIKAREVDEYLLCGPLGMVQELKVFLKNAGVEGDKIHIELFNAGQEAEVQEKGGPSEAGTDGETQVSIRLDGNILNFTMASRRQSLLDAAMTAGADLPFSCKGGVCCTCKARILEGAAEMKLNYALEPEEVKAGYILTCQARPTTNRISIDFDQ